MILAIAFGILLAWSIRAVLRGILRHIGTILIIFLIIWLVGYLNH